MHSSDFHASGVCSFSTNEWVQKVFDILVLLFLCFQIAYKIAREQFSGRLQETFLVLSDDPSSSSSIAPQSVARRLSLEQQVQDPRSGSREASRKHPRGSDSASSDSSVIAKRPDQTRSSEKRK